MIHNSLTPLQRSAILAKVLVSRSGEIGAQRVRNDDYLRVKADHSVTFSYFLEGSMLTRNSEVCSYGTFAYTVFRWSGR